MEGVKFWILARAVPARPASGGRAGLGPPGKGLGRSCQARHTGSSIIASGAISSPLLNLERGRREGKRPRFLPSPPLPSRGAHHLGRAGASSAASGLTSPGRRAGDAGRGREPRGAEAARGAGRGGAGRPAPVAMAAPRPGVLRGAAGRGCRSPAPSPNPCLSGNAGLWAVVSNPGALSLEARSATGSCAG